jgi:hypothetical protein
MEGLPSRRSPPPSPPPLNTQWDPYRVSLQAPYNVERLFYLLTDAPNDTRAWMRTFSTTGTAVLPTDTLHALHSLGVQSSTWWSPSSCPIPHPPHPPHLHSGMPSVQPSLSMRGCFAGRPSLVAHRVRPRAHPLNPFGPAATTDQAAVARCTKAVWDADAYPLCPHTAVGVAAATGGQAAWGYSRETDGALVGGDSRHHLPPPISSVPSPRAPSTYAHCRCAPPPPHSHGFRSCWPPPTRPSFRRVCRRAWASVMPMCWPCPTLLCLP